MIAVVVRACPLLLLGLLAGCAMHPGARPSACSDPLGLYTASAYDICCRGHDVAYRVGGDERDRLKADQALYVCIRDMGSESDAASMFYAVRLGGRDRFQYRKGPTP